MNAQRLKAALKKHAEQTGTEAEVKALLASDEKKYTPEEVGIIYQAIVNPTVKEDKPAAPKVKALPNDKIDLSKFDYENLTGQAFDDYQAVVKKLMIHDDHDFEQYMASGVFEMEFDKQLNKVHTLVGIRLNSSKPINSTRIPVGIAKNMNDQILNRDNPASNSRCYLLKK